MNYRDRIMSDLADRECKSISRKVIRRLQRMTKERQSGDDSILKNVWDEICVQVQEDLSYLWAAYLMTIEQFIDSEIKKVDRFISEAIYLQTKDGMDWDCEM